MARDIVITIRCDDAQVAVLDDYAAKHGIVGGRAGAIRAVIDGLTPPGQPSNLSAAAALKPSAAPLSTQKTDPAPRSRQAPQGRRTRPRSDVSGAKVKEIAPARRTDSQKEEQESRPSERVQAMGPADQSVDDWWGVSPGEWELVERYGLLVRLRDRPNAAEEFFDFLSQVACASEAQRGTPEHLEEADRAL
jgi:hypothetical protein